MARRIGADSSSLLSDLSKMLVTSPSRLMRDAVARVLERRVADLQLAGGEAAIQPLDS